MIYIIFKKYNNLHCNIIKMGLYLIAGVTLVGYSIFLLGMQRIFELERCRCQD